MGLPTNTTTAYIEWAKTECYICEKCRRQEVPTETEKVYDAKEEMYRSELQANLDVVDTLSKGET